MVKNCKMKCYEIKGGSSGIKNVGDYMEPLKLYPEVIRCWWPEK